MDNKEQKLVGYIVYNIWTYKHKGREDTEWTTAAISPEVHWKKKIYLTLSRAQEAAKHMKERESLSTQIIVPLYANYDDFNKVNEGYKELNAEIEKLKNMNKERYNQIIDDAWKNYQHKASKQDFLKDGVLRYEGFIDKIKTDTEFSEKWGLKIEEKELSLEERHQISISIIGHDGIADRDNITWHETYNKTKHSNQTNHNNIQQRKNRNI